MKYFGENKRKKHLSIALLLVAYLATLIYLAKYIA